MAPSASLKLPSKAQPRIDACHMRYIEFTQRQDIHHLLACMVHGFRYFGGVTESVLTDRMKTVLLDQTGGELHFNKKFLEFAAYYGFVPRVCRPYRPETNA
jgi:transposase